MFLASFHQIILLSRFFRLSPVLLHVFKPFPLTLPSLRMIVRVEQAVFSGLWVTMMIVWPSSRRLLKRSMISLPVFVSRFL
jgi:hypothetical protein